jgi:hypothetical protein
LQLDVRGLSDEYRPAHCRAAALMHLLGVTLSQGIEVAITQAISEIDRVVDVTDHASGTNPYFEQAKK